MSQVVLQWQPKRHLYGSVLAGSGQLEAAGEGKDVATLDAEAAEVGDAMCAERGDPRDSEVVDPASEVVGARPQERDRAELVRSTLEALRTPSAAHSDASTQTAIALVALRRC